MPAIGSITLADGQGTPVNHTFTPQYPQRDNNSPATWFDKSAGITVGYLLASILVRDSNGPLPGSKVTVRVVRPTLEQTSPSTATGIQPAPTLAYNHVFNGEYTCPKRGSKAERQDIYAYSKNFLAHANVKAAVEDLETTW